MDILHPDEQDRASYERRLQEIAEEEAFDARLARVFGSADGIEVAEWVLGILGYWKPVKDVPLYEAGRLFLHKLAAADIDLWHRLVERQQARATDAREAEKRTYNQRIKEMR